MEYLMTYGWAILIIAVVLGALFSLGVFSGAALLGTTCIASSGYLCTSLSYVSSAHATNQGNVVVTLGQNTGTSWAAVDFAYAPQGTATGTSGIPSIPSGAVVAYASGIPSGGTLLNVALPVTSTSTGNVLGGQAVGTSTVGTIWACYLAAPTSLTIGAGAFNALTNCNYVAIATMSAKAT
jgi:hypothetical protein